MDTTAPPDPELAFREASEAGEHNHALELTVQAYGGELYGFLRDRVRNDGVAQDLFSELLESLLKTWARFEWRCSARTWCYVIARRVLLRHYRAPSRSVLLSRASDFPEWAQQARDSTAAFRRTEVKSRARELRLQLSDEDQTILVLRLERGLAFVDVARVLAGDPDLAGADLKREAGRLRKRFSLAKQRLTTLLKEDGLIADD